MCGLLPVFCCSFFRYLEPSLHCVIQCGLLSRCYLVPPLRLHPCSLCCAWVQRVVLPLRGLRGQDLLRQTQPYLSTPAHLQVLDRLPHYCPVCAYHEWNLDGEPSPGQSACHIQLAIGWASRALHLHCRFHQRIHSTCTVNICSKGSLMESYGSKP